MDNIVLFDDFLENIIYRAVSQGPRVSDKVLGNLLDILVSMSFESDGVKYIERDSALNFFRNFVLALEEGDGRFLFIRRGLRVNKVVDVEEFTKSREYLDLGMTIRPKLMELLYELFHGKDSEYIFEVPLCGAIGWGKSFFAADVASTYILYKLSCYHSPQLEYKLAPGSPIVFTMQSVRLDQAKRVLFNPFCERVRRSPYFMRNFPFDPNVTTELRFPNQITVLPLSSSDTAALGYNVFNAVMDELNFLAFVENSARIRGSEDIYDQASKLYMTTFRRIKSRFQIAGKSPGKLFLISSANYPGDFMDRRRKEAEEQLRSGKRRTIFMVTMSRWEALPPGTFSDEKFLVEVGDAVKKSRLISDRSEAIDSTDVIEVPIDFKEEFEKDLEAAIRDIAGIPVGSSNSFIKQRDKLVEAAKVHQDLYGGTQLFTVDRVELARRADVLHSLVDIQYLAHNLSSSLPYVAHVDLGLTGDSCGVSVGHFNGMQYVGKVFNWDTGSGKYREETGGEFPSITIDGIIEIVNVPGDEVDISTVGDLLLTLASMINLILVTADRFQSVALLQKLRKARTVIGKRIKTAIVSVDTHLEPYMELKQSFRDGRILIPPVPKLLKELRELQLDLERGKVDHPRSGSKDLADAICGVSYTLSQLFGKRKSRLLSAIRGESTERTIKERGKSTLRMRRLH